MQKLDLTEDAKKFLLAGMYVDHDRSFSNRILARDGLAGVTAGHTLWLVGQKKDGGGEWRAYFPDSLVLDAEITSPNLDYVINENAPHTVYLPVDELRAAAEAAIAYGRDRVRRWRATYRTKKERAAHPSPHEGAITISIGEYGTSIAIVDSCLRGRMREGAGIKGDITVSVDPVYLRDAVAALEAIGATFDVAIDVSDKLSPINVRAPEVDGYKCIIMPMNV